jgi:hypothetical protein
MDDGELAAAAVLWGREEEQGPRSGRHCSCCFPWEKKKVGCRKQQPWTGKVEVGHGRSHWGEAPREKVAPWEGKSRAPCCRARAPWEKDLLAAMGTREEEKGAPAAAARGRRCRGCRGSWSPGGEGEDAMGGEGAPCVLPCGRRSAGYCREEERDREKKKVAARGIDE